MAWLAVSLETDCAHAEALADWLIDNGALAATIEDAAAGTPEEKPQFGEPGEISAPGWERSRLAILLPGDTSRAALATLLTAAAEAVGLAAAPAWQASELAEENWVQMTQAQFAPIRISPRLWIVPSWHAAPDPAAINIVLDPGMAFGTGSHPTTRLCLQWLESTLTPGSSLLDYGCGSGILAIAGAKLGAAPVCGIDIDPQAISAAQENARNNAGSGEAAISFYTADQPLAGTAATFDYVVANILANPLKALAPALAARVSPGGALALAGILVEQAEEMIAIYAPWISLAVAGSDDGWVCLAGRKDSRPC